MKSKEKPPTRTGAYFVVRDRLCGRICKERSDGIAIVTKSIASTAIRSIARFYLSSR